MRASTIGLASLLLCASSLGCATTRLTGHAAPDFVLPALDGPTVSLSSLKGQVALVDFWASWCGPCRAELPALEQLRRDYEPRGVRFVTVSVDSDREAAAQMAKELSVTMPVALDAHKQVAEAWQLSTMPSSFVIDRDGVIRYVHEGFYGTADVEAFKRELDTLLAPR